MVGNRGALPALLILLIIVAGGIGCGADRGRVADEPGRPDEASTDEASPEEASLGGAYLPAGFGEGSLWATDIFTCDDTGREEAQEVFEEVAYASSENMLLKRPNPRTGEVEAKVDLKDVFANVTEVAFGAGSVWVSSADYGPGPVEERQPYDAVSG